MAEPATPRTAAKKAGALGLVRSLFAPKNKAVEKEKKHKKEVLIRQNKLLKEEIKQSWKIVFGDEVPKKKKEISVIQNVTARNIWMEDQFLFNHIKQLKPEEQFHSIDEYALKWSPPGSLFRILIPMNDPKVQENAISLISKMTKSQQKKLLFHFSPISASTSMYAPHVHPASLVSYRTKNSVLKKLSQCFIEGKISVEEIQLVSSFCKIAFVDDVLELLILRVFLWYDGTLFKCKIR